MAKRKISKAGLMEYGGFIVGGALASKVATLNVPMIPEKVKPILPIVLGYFLAQRGGTIANVGKGMITVGSIKALGAFVPALGISEEVSDYMIEGADDYALAGETVSGNEGYALAGQPMDFNTNSDLFG
jgi:hypothetical protein